MKRNKAMLLLVVTAVLMSACAKTVWMNPDVPDKQAQKDLAECQIMPR